MIYQQQQQKFNLFDKLVEKYEICHYRAFFAASANFGGLKWITKISSFLLGYKIIKK